MFKAKATVIGTPKQVEEMLKTLPDRSAYVRDSFMKVFVEAFIKEVKRPIPKFNNEEWARYVDSLEIREIKVDRDRERTRMLLVASFPSSKSLKDTPSDRTVVHIRARTPENAKQITLLLASFSPWTMDTLPAMPDKDDAFVVYKVVSKNEVTRLRAEKLDEMGKIRAMLQRAGVKAPPPPEDIGEIRALQDTDLVGIRLEFGLTGYPEIAHWRPAIRKFRKSLAARFVAQSRLLHTLMRPTDKTYVRKEKPFPSLPLTATLKYARFGKKVRGQT